MSQNAVIEPHYWPGAAWWATYLLKPEETLIDIHSHYLKQTFRNRCMLLGPNSVVNLAIPIKHNGGQKQALKDALVDHSALWKSNHKNTLKSVYGKAPYFEFYADRILDLYNHKFDYLIDYQLKSIEIGLQILKLKYPIICTESYLQPSPELRDFRDLYSNPQKSVEQKALESIVPYKQVFGNEFIAGAGLPDLIFNLGPASLSYLKKLAEVLHPTN